MNKLRFLILSMSLIVGSFAQAQQNELDCQVMEPASIKASSYEELKKMKVRCTGQAEALRYAAGLFFEINNKEDADYMNNRLHRGADSISEIISLINSELKLRPAGSSE